mgnify:CR=1 FL=1
MDAGIKVVGYQDFDWDVPVPAHRRTHGGILLVRGGSGSLGVRRADDSEDGKLTEGPECRTTRFDVEPGDTVIYLPYEDHSYHPDRGSVLSASMIRFEVLPDSQIAEHVGLLGPNRRFPGLAAVEQLFDYVKDRLREKNEFASRAAEAAIAALLNQAIACRSPRPPVARETPIDQAMETLYADFGSRLTIVARTLGLSVETIRKEFRKHFGSSPMHYITAYRVSCIAYRLETEDATLQELADEYGFYDEFHLSRVFKRYVGLPPSEYRKRNLSQS